MSITTTISKPLEPGYVQVDSKEKNGYTRYYKVPQTNAKVFSNELKVQDKKMNRYTNAAIFGTMFACVLGVSCLTKKMKSKLQQLLIQMGTAVASMTAVSLGMYSCEEKEHDKLLLKHHAKEIFYKE